MITPEPKRPRPEDFGLTEERLEALRAGPGRRPSLMVYGSVLVMAFVIVTIMLAKYGIPSSAAGKSPPPTAVLILLMTLSLAFWLGIFAGPLIRWLERRWRRLQPDSAASDQYERAILRYTLEHAAWLKTQHSWWRSLRPSDFEVQVASNLRQRGYEVLRTGRSRDGGVDIRARVPGGASIIAQCKAYQQPVGPAAIRELYGTLMHEGAQEGWLVALAGFSEAAKQFAEGKPLRLLGVDMLIGHSGRF